MSIVASCMWLFEASGGVFMYICMAWNYWYLVVEKPVSKEYGYALVYGHVSRRLVEKEEAYRQASLDI